MTMANSYIMESKCSNYTKGQLIVFLTQLNDNCNNLQEYTQYLDNFIKTLDPQKLNEIQGSIDEVFTKMYNGHIESRKFWTSKNNLNT